MPAVLKRCVGLLLLARLCLATPALAGHASAQLAVSATVPTSVSIGVGAPGVGGIVDLGSGTTGTVSLSVTSNTATPVTVLMGQGSNAAPGSSDTAPLRRMTSGSNYLNYQLYQDAAESIPWGNAAGTGQSLTASGQVNLKLYVGILPGQNPPVGTYSDVVVMTVSY
jgi:spore coat protein U-like protein